MKCFLDMDGVLADYFTAVETLMEVEHYSHIYLNHVINKIRLNDGYKDCSCFGSRFFANLNKLPNMEKLVWNAYDLFGEYHIITTPLREHEYMSMAGKISWINHNLLIKPKSIVFTDNKAQYAMGNLLIDDYRPNIDKWNAAGGIGIKYKALSKNYTIDDVIEQMHKIKSTIN